MPKDLATIYMPKLLKYNIMAQEKYRHIYGPVYSWRLKRSLGIDIVSQGEKLCNFDCVYCQVGTAKPFGSERKVYVPTDELLKEIKSLSSLKIDYITFSGSGEPTLALNLGEAIKKIKEIRKEKIAVITNASLVDRPDVRNDLNLADLVMLKLDAYCEEIFVNINKPEKSLKLSNILNGIKEFKKSYKGKLILQIMFIKDNKDYAKDLAGIAKDISPDGITINTPLRPSNAKPLTKTDIDEIMVYFKGMNAVSLYDTEKVSIEPLDSDGTMKRRGEL